MMQSGGQIGYYDDGLSSNSKSNPTIPSAGGVIGDAGKTSIMDLSNIVVQNLNIRGANAGGFIGKIQNAAYSRVRI